MTIEQRVELMITKEDIIKLQSILDYYTRHCSYDKKGIASLEKIVKELQNEVIKNDTRAKS